MKNLSIVPVLMLSFVAAARSEKVEKPADETTTQLVAAIDSRDWKSLRTKIESQLPPLLADISQADPNQIIRLVSARAAAKYFASAKISDAQADALKWIARQPDVFATFVFAVTQNDDPARVLTVLAALREDQGDRLIEFPDLLAALCVVWDGLPVKAGAAQPPADTQRAALLARYYISARAKLRFDPKNLPWQLAVFVVDNSASADEIAWAVQHYAGRGNVGAAFFDVPYDLNVYYGTRSKQIDGHDYTLPNLIRYGGICVDQAYFGTTVARSIGVPAATCIGMGAMSSDAHAWVGYLRAQNKSASWDFSEGRYPEYQFCRGQVHDPQTGDNLSDADVSVLAELMNASSADRLTSLALADASDLSADRSVEILTRAINLSPGNRRAWEQLAELGAQNKLDAAQTKSFKDVVAKFALKKYPDFAFSMLARIDAGKDAAARVAMLDQIKPLFPNRPDLQADIGLSKGDLLRAANRSADALAAYGEIISRFGYAGPIVLEAMDHLEPLLAQAHDSARLAAAYKMAWQRVPQPDITGHVRQTPYYILGKRYETVLEQMSGANNDLAYVRARLGVFEQAAMNKGSTR